MIKTMAFSLLIFCSTILLTACDQDKQKAKSNMAAENTEILTLQKENLLDKIKGGWAGQVIGCTYGGPTEFRFCGTMIQDYTPIPWDENRMKWYYDNEPGLYDDIYMDLTFVEVIEKEGLEAPAIAHARAFANADYQLWHANQAARYNILNGLEPPASGFWENNPHADDIDFQIEADFAGLMSPGMVNTASEICDRVGHIMNYGDGWYGGVYVAALYSSAFIYSDIETIVREGLKSIPAQSEFYQCISDVINWYHAYPEDWKQTWFACEKKWSSDIGCPDGVFSAFNIDAKINAAYVTIGLLYGDGDYGKTIDISARCGQDSDCNPASAAGVLGTLLGYSKIPDYWKQGLDMVEDLDFKYTHISLNDAYQMSYHHALQNITMNDGKVTDKEVFIKTQQPLPVKFEKGFLNHFPKSVLGVDGGHEKLDLQNNTYSFEFEGVGFVVKGYSVKHPQKNSGKDHVPEIDIMIDDSLIEKAILPTDFTKRKNEICWKFNLPMRKHKVSLKLLNPAPNVEVLLDDILIYVGKP